MAQNLSDLAFEAPHAGLPRVVLDDLAQRLVGDLDLARLQAVRLHLPRHQVAPRNLQLLVGGVTGKADDFHAVAQRPGIVSSMFAVVMNTTRLRSNGTASNCRGRNCSARIEHFEQRRAGIAVNAGASLSISSSIMTQLRVPALRTPG